MTRAPRIVEMVFHRFCDDPCTVCSLPVGLLWPEADGTTCTFCDRGVSRPTPRVPRMPAESDADIPM